MDRPEGIPYIRRNCLFRPLHYLSDRPSVTLLRSAKTVSDSALVNMGSY